MSLLNIFKNQLGQVISWENQKENQLWFKYPSKLDEIKDGSKLILAPGQGVLLVYEGKIVNHLEEQGTYNLFTHNHPFITTLINLWKNFESEHKLYIYFYRKADVVNQQWGSPSRIKYIDNKYQIPVQIGVHGNFSYKIENIEKLYANLITNQEEYKTDQIRVILNDRIAPLVNSYLATEKLSFNDIDSKQESIGLYLKDKISSEFESFGLSILDFKLLSIDFDDETLTRINRLADMNIEVQSAEIAGLDYVALEKLRALRDAARNEGGLAGIGAQLGAGMEISKLFSIEKDNAINNIEKEKDISERLKQLKSLQMEDIITQEEFDQLKAKILKNI